MAKSIQISRQSTIEMPDISSYKLVVEAVNAIDMPDKIFVMQQITNFARGTTDAVFAAICTPAQLEDFEEDSPGVGTSYYRTNRIELVARTPEFLETVFDSLLYETKKLVNDLIYLDDLSETAIYDVSAEAPITEVFNAPTIISINGNSSKLLVYFNPPPPSNSTLSIKTYQYSLDGGNTWNWVNPSGVTSPIAINGLQAGNSYAVKIRAVYRNNQTGVPSSIVYGYVIDATGSTGA